MERSTKKIITPIEKHEVLIVEWITGIEYEEIQKPITDIKLMIDTMGIAKGEVNAGEAARKSTENAIETVIISVNGEKKDILGKVGSMHKDDYLFVLKEIDKIVKGKNFTQPV